MEVGILLPTFPKHQFRGSIPAHTDPGLRSAAPSSNRWSQAGQICADRGTDSIITHNQLRASLEQFHTPGSPWQSPPSLTGNLLSLPVCSGPLMME
ncbi:hypothetical protein SKAU_G00129980 [Synaphobranchus kaupii]|uniref:Uncharacterized protein n=1 Tax=Synaphobranchus kaupii TaxID=118154 RepID=A0A9Q1FR71_SYNKA|nr:hypothetical protein SKAU_G00129980 [Synaphobranchus kaupii]